MKNMLRRRLEPKPHPHRWAQKKVPIPGDSGALAPSVTVNFAGLNRPAAANHGFVFVPPDTTSAKSPNHVIEATNSAVRLFTPAGTILATADLNTFFVASTTQGLL